MSYEDAEYAWARQAELELLENTPAHEVYRAIRELMDKFIVRGPVLNADLKYRVIADITELLSHWPDLYQFTVKEDEQKGLISVKFQFICRMESYDIKLELLR